MRQYSVEKKAVSAIGRALRFCLLPLAFCLALPRGLFAVCTPGQTPVMPSYSFSIPGPDWYRNEGAGEYCFAAYCVNYFGGPSNNYYSYVGVRSPEYKMYYNCPSGCCYPSGVPTLDEYLDGRLVTGAPYGSLRNGAHVYVIENISFRYYTCETCEATTVNYPSIAKTFNVDGDPPQITFSQPGNNVIVSTMEASITVGADDQVSGLESATFQLVSGKAVTSYSPEILPGCGLKKTLPGAAADSATLHESSVTYCSGRLAVFLGTAPFCNGNLGGSSFTKTYDLRDYVDFSAGLDCAVKFTASVVDKVGYSTGVAGWSKMELDFMVDQAPPAIIISTWPMALSSGPSTLIAGTAADLSEILDLKFTLRQFDWQGATTYWNGADWGEPSVTISVAIPAGKKAFAWSYSGLRPEDMISGSRYSLAVYSTDKFHHAASKEIEFLYNACSASTQPVAGANYDEDIYETGTALFRELGAPLNHNKGHVGLYVVSDSQYLEENGRSTTTFVQKLISNQGRLLPMFATDARHFVVHATQEDGGVVYTPAAGFMTRPYWGAYEWPFLTPVLRDRIAFFASLQLGKPYAKMYPDWPLLPIGKDWAGPDSFRCDGLVVYAYKQARLDVAVSGQDNPLLDYPRDLAKNWEPVKSAVPELYDLKVTPTGNNFNLSVQAEDKESGIDRVDYFLRKHWTYPDAGIDFLGAVDNDSLGPSTYILPNTCNPKGNLYAKAVDRAGNWQLSDQAFNEYRSAPLKTYSFPTNSVSPWDYRMLFYPVAMNRVDWHYQDDTTPAEQLLALYTVDIPYDSWDYDNVNAVQGGDAGSWLGSGPGAHILYLAVTDDYGNVTLKQDSFTTPDFRAIFAGENTVQAGDDVALSFENETAPGAYSAEKMDMVWPAPEGYFSSPASAAYDVKTTAQYSGGIGLVAKIDGQNLSDEEKKHLHLLHLTGGIWEEATVGIDPVNNVIFGYATTLSPFAIYTSPDSVPVRAYPDRWPPLTKITTSEAPYTGENGEQYISSTTDIGFTSVDNYSKSFSTFYKFDISPELIAAGLTSETTWQFSVFPEKFAGSEGKHVIGYASVDAAGNYELLKTATFYIDGTPPSITLTVSSGQISDGGTAYLTETDSVTLMFVDPESNGVASDIKAVYCLIDVSPDTCQTKPDFIGPAGTCRNPLYTGPFTLEVGTHTIYYSAEDNAGNRATEKSAFIIVLPPVTLTSIVVSPSLVFVEIGGVRQFAATGNFSDGTSRLLGAADGLAWSVEHATVAAVSPGGLVSGLAYGRTRVRAAAGGLVADAGLFVYEPAPARFSAAGPMITGRHMHTATLLPDGKVLVAGGNNKSQILSSAELYNPATKTFTATGSLLAPRGRGHTATLLPNGKVLVTGGISGGAVAATAELYDPATGAFTATGRLAVVRYAHSATLLANGKVLITGGSDENEPVSLAELYDPASGTFSTTGRMAAGRYYHTAVLLGDGKVLVAGGLAGPGRAHVSSAELYDPVAGTFAAAGSMSFARAYPRAVLLPDGKVLVTGGYSGAAPVLPAELYDPAARSFSAAGTMSIGRIAGHTATLLPNDKVLVAGGDEDGTNDASATAEVYDPAAKAFTLTASMSAGRIYHAAALLLPDGEVLVSGGYNGLASVSSAELYNFGFGAPVTLLSLAVNPSTATIEVGGTRQFTAMGNFNDGSSRVLSSGLAWSVDYATVAAVSSAGLATGVALGKALVTVSSGSLSASAVLTVAPPAPKFHAAGPMLAGRHLHTATLLPNGKVLIAGGNNSAQILASAELYDPVTKTFTATGSMLAPRGRGHTATLLPNGKVLVTGGISGGAVVATAELYDPATGAFTATGQMAVVRYAHSATLLAGGKVLISGGSDENEPVSTAELYDPVTGTFSTTGLMAAGRYMHAAVLLADGKVLVAGGLVGPGRAHASSAEVYDPVTGTFAAVGSMSAARAYPRTVLMKDGKVLVTGGYSGTAPVLPAELYDPASRSFSVAGTMSIGRIAGHTATLLPDGKVLVAGGDENGNNNASSSAELYDPAVNNFSLTASMSVGRIYHAAALLLPNGEVLVCGGYNGSLSVASAELYDSGFRGTLSPWLTSILVKPSTAAVVTGGAQQFTATGNYNNGSSRLLTPADGLAWSVGHATVAAISADGLAAGIAYGRTGVTARSGIFSSEAALAVFYAPAVSADALVSINSPDAVISVTPVSTVTVSTTPIFAAMSAVGLKPAMDAFYDFKPDGVQFATPVKLSFTFDPALVDPAAVAIYYFDGVAWSSASIANQVTGLLADGRAYVAGYISHTSIYAALYFKDVLPPVTRPAFAGPNFGTGPVYISSLTAISLAAYDDAVTPGDRLGSAATSYYAVDSDVFRVYSGTFSVAGEGGHILGYYSVDTAGNREALKSINITVDVSPAVSTFSLAGAAGLNGWYVSSVAAALASTDSLSGVAAAYYAAGDGQFTLYGSSFGITTEGVHSLRHYAVDNIGNTEAEKSIRFSIDTSTPVVTAAGTPGPNAAGWNNTPVSVVFTGTDAVSGIAYCEPAKLVDIEVAGRLVTGYCIDYAGWSSTASLTVNLDTTAPSMTYDIQLTGEGLNISTPAAASDYAGNSKDILVSGMKIDRTPPVSTAAVSGIYRNGWYSSAVGLVLGSTDALSGVKEIYYSLDGGDHVNYRQPVSVNSDGSHEVKYYAVDRAGNMEAAGKAGFRIDRQAPDIGYILNPVFNAAGWNNSAVSVVFTGTDAVSGIEECSSGNIALEGAGQKIAGWCKDFAGNIAYTTATINVDLTIPSVSVTQAPGRNAYGWNNTPVTAVFSGTDTVSGIAYCSSAALLETEGSSRTLAGYCADYAGWTSTASLTVNLDTTAPSMVYAAEPAANEAGWHNSEVVLKFTCADGLSGVRSCPAAISLSGEGVNISTSGAAYDLAGNSKNILVSGVKIDRTPPACAAALSGTYRNGWYSSTVSAVLSSTDTLSGVKRILYRLDGPGGSGGEKVYSGPVEFSANGKYKLYYAAEDAAGNREGEKVIGFNIDTAAPLVEHTLLPAPNTGGWNNTAVQVVFTGTDTASGVEQCSSQTVAIEGALQKVPGWCRDLAGNIGYSTATVNIDHTPPAITVSSPTAGQIYIATRGKIYAGFGVRDNLDPAPVFNTFLVQTEDKGSPRGNRPAIIPVINGQSIEPLDIDDGLWRLTAGATDFADNSSSAAGGLFEVIHDVLPPRTVLAAGADSYQGMGQAMYVTGRTTVTLTSMDDLVAAADGIGLGVKKQSIGVSAAGMRLPRDLVFENINPTQGASFVSTFRFDRETDGAYGLAYNSEDVLANREEIKVSTFIVDNTPPQTTFSRVSGPAYRNYVSTWTLFELASADPGAFASGVKETAYSINSGAITASPLKFTLPGIDDNYFVKYQSRDNLENLEVEKSSQVFVDAAPPFSALNVIGGKRYPGAVAGSFYTSLVSKFGFEAEDPVIGGGASGIKSIDYADNGGLYVAYSQPISLGEGKHAITYRASDRVENTEVARSTQVYIDNTAPITSFNIAGPLYIKDGVRYITPASALTFSAIDPLIKEVAAGVERVETSVDGGQWLEYTQALKFVEGRHTIKYRAIDNVGNVETERVLEVQSDNTAPVSAWSAASGDRVERGNKFYLNALGRIAFESTDPVINNVASGVEGIYYGIDAVPADKYAAPFGLTEGIRTIKFSAKDNVGNAEVVRSTVIYVDGTKPASELSVSGDQYKSDRQYISRRTDIVIVSTDPVVNDVSVGVKEMKYAVDSGSFNNYSQFKLSAEGKRLVSFYSADHVNNMEAVKTAELWVDGTAPLSVLAVLGGKQYPGSEPGGFYASSATKFGFIAVDPVVSDGAAGVKTMKYADNGDTSVVYAQPISLVEGKHLITYHAMDRVENTEVFRSTQIYIDNTAPITSFNIAEPLYIKDGIRYITSASALMFTAADPLAKEVSAGVERIETAVDGGPWAKYTQALKFGEGRHTIKYRAIDNVGNAEAERIIEVQSDNTAPVSVWSAAGGPWIEKDNKFYLNALGSIALESADPIRNNVASGLENIYYGIDAAPAVKYLAAFSLAEGVRTVNYSAKDNVGNTEVAKSTVIYVDGTKPVTGLSLSGDQYKGEKQYISQRTEILITAVDPAVNNVAAGVKDTRYSVDGGLFVNYSLFKLSAEGKRLVSYYSTDFVANTETVKTAALWVDNTTPSTELTVTGARYSAPGDEKLYITRDSGLVLTSSDPLGNDTASGVLLTKYRLDGGSWQVYSGSFTIAAEGLHTLEYYSLDRVQNAEILKSAKIAVDNTPPAAAISLGGPEAEAFGLPILTPSSRVTLSATDPIVNGAASGLNSIFYELKNMQTDALTPVTAYLSPFTMPGQGTFSIRYWSKDNTGNTETPKEQIAAVTTWLEDGLAAVSGLEMSGTADISGSVKSNASVSLSGNARILGDVTASTITLAGKAQITGLQVSGSAPVNPAPIILDGIIQSAQAANSNGLVADYLVDGKLVLGSKTGITLSTGTYYFKGMELSGGSSITIAGKVDIVVEGGIAINGGGSVNASGAASRLSIIVSTSSELKFSGGAALVARVYAPYSSLKLAGNALLGGHYFVNSAAMSGAGNILQSGEDLPVAAAQPGGGPKTKAAAMPSSNLGILAGPDPAFRIGEVYVFPNPAKGADAPVFHIETGIADSVKITIYTISGRVAHEHTLTALPAELDDGNGLSYAYEYVWRGHIPSGVYLYYIEAQKSGQKLKKTGKFGIVR